MKTLWQSALFIAGMLGRIIGASVGGACLGAVIGGLEGLLIGPFTFFLLLLHDLPLPSGETISHCVSGMGYEAQILAAFGTAAGTIAFGIVQSIHLLSVQRESTLRFDFICGVAARCALLCAFCGAITGGLSSYSYEFPSGGLSVEGSVIGWSAGFAGGAAWSRIALKRPKVSLFPLDRIVGWLWGKS